MKQGTQSQCSVTTQMDRVGRRGSGWGTHVHLWPINSDVWQSHHNIVIILQLKLINQLKKKPICLPWVQSLVREVRFHIPQGNYTHMPQLVWVIVAQSCLTLWDSMDCSPPGSVRGISRQECWSGLPFPSPATTRATAKNKYIKKINKKGVHLLL